MPKNRALFLDRDGVINRRIVGGYVQHPEEFELLPEILPVLAYARNAGYLLIQISNQQGVGKGLMTNDQLIAVTEHMQGLLKSFLGEKGLDDCKVCTDLASANSPRRKPAPGMLLEAIEEHHLVPAECWFVGDSLTDAIAGKAAGVKTALIGDFSSDSADLVLAGHHELRVLERLL